MLLFDLKNERTQMGLLLSFVCVVWSAFSFTNDGTTWQISAFISLLFSLCTLVYPSFFFLPLLIWKWFGRAIAYILQPIILGILYFVFVWFTSVLVKLANGDLLNSNVGKHSNWSVCNKVDYDEEYFVRQF